MDRGPLRIGVSGLGFGATVHIPALQSEGVDVIAVHSRRQERAQETATRFSIAHAFSDYNAMLALDGLDAVAIATPPAAHKAMTLAALAAGKHVLLEKPFTLDQNEAYELLQAAEASGKTAMIAHEFRFASGRMRVKELLDEGYIGTPRLALVRVVLGGMAPGQPAGTIPPYNPDRDDAGLGGGFLFGLGSHYIDCLRHWFGDVASVSASLATFAPQRRQAEEVINIDADDTFMAELTFSNGVLAQIVGTRMAPFGPGAAIELYGSEGALVTPQKGVNPPAHGTVLGARLGEERLQELSVPERLQPFADDRDDRLMPFRLLVREFWRGIETGSSPAPDFNDGYRCQQVLDAVRLSAASGKRVDIAL